MQFLLNNIQEWFIKFNLLYNILKNLQIIIYQKISIINFVLYY